MEGLEHEPSFQVALKAMTSMKIFEMEVGDT